MKNSLSEPGTAWKSTDREAGGAREKEEPRGVCVCVEERGKQRERETERKKIKRLSLNSREVMSRRRRAILQKVKLHE